MIRTHKEEIQRAKQTLDTAEKTTQTLAKQFQDANLGVEVDIQGATLDEVQKQYEDLNVNVAKMIVGLDNITKELGSHFDTMREKTMSEKLVGFFSKAKSDEMRESRMQDADLEVQLQELISESTQLSTMLKGQLKVLEGEKESVDTNLERVLKDRESQTEELKQLDEKLKSLDPEILSLQDEIANSVDSSERAKLETKLEQVTKEQQETQKNRDVVLSKSQSNEGYIESYKVFSSSLATQIGTQKVQIAKLDNDTKNRTIIYAATNKSILTAQQQKSAHELHKIGAEVDKSVTETAAMIEAGAKAAMVETLERHNDQMVSYAKIQDDSKQVNDMFERAMGDIIQKHELKDYK